MLFSSLIASTLIASPGSSITSCVMPETPVGIMTPVTVATGEEPTEVRIGGAKVVKTDIVASNGVFHVIDSVIPPE